MATTYETVSDIEEKIAEIQDGEWGISWMIANTAKKEKLVQKLEAQRDLIEEEISTEKDIIEEFADQKESLEKELKDFRYILDRMKGARRHFGAITTK